MFYCDIKGQITGDLLKLVSLCIVLCLRHVPCTCVNQFLFSALYVCQDCLLCSFVNDMLYKVSRLLTNYLKNSYCTLKKTFNAPMFKFELWSY